VKAQVRAWLTAQKVGKVEPEALGDDVLESCLYILRENVAGVPASMKGDAQERRDWAAAEGCALVALGLNEGRRLKSVAMRKLFARKPPGYVASMKGDAQERRDHPVRRPGSHRRTRLNEGRRSRASRCVRVDGFSDPFYWPQ
jgi:hypothetical protein